MVLPLPSSEVFHDEVPTASRLASSHSGVLSLVYDQLCVVPLAKVVHEKFGLVETYDHGPRGDRDSRVGRAQQCREGLAWWPLCVSEHLSFVHERRQGYGQGHPRFGVHQCGSRIHQQRRLQVIVNVAHQLRLARRRLVVGHIGRVL